MKLTFPFDIHQNFLDPQLTKDGKPYGPYRYKQIIQECYLLTKNLNTSYTDILKISPIEREYLLKFLADEIKKSKQLIEKKKK